MIGKRSLLLIGESPGPRGDRHKPLEGAIGRRLAKYLGMSFEDYLRGTRRLNLFAGPIARWSVRSARRAAFMLLMGFKRERVLLLGRRVGAAFGFWPKAKLFVWRYSLGAGRWWMAVIPHPSGRNRWWNDPKHRAEARAFFRKVGDGQ